jgi:hypothetical protein
MKDAQDGMYTYDKVTYEHSIKSRLVGMVDMTPINL